MVAIVDGGSERGVLNLGREKGRRSSRFRWKQADKLKSFCVRPRACNAVVFGNGFVNGGRNFKKPIVAKL